MLEVLYTSSTSSTPSTPQSANQCFTVSMTVQQTNKLTSSVNSTALPQEGICWHIYYIITSVC